jgi:hypothetical protein
MSSAEWCRLNATGVLFIAAAFSVEGCSGSSSNNGRGAPGASGSNGGASGTTLTAGTSATPSPSPCEGRCPDTAERPTPLPRPNCPEVEPDPGSECEDPDLECSYGDSPTPACRHHYQCKSAAWNVLSDAAHPCVMPVDCPAAPPAVGTSCTVSSPGIPCDYGDQLCYCGRAPDDLSVGVPGTWACFGAPVNPACPARLPNIGEGCEPQALACDYAINGCTAPPDSTVFCRDGAWEEGEKLRCISK